MLVSPVFVIAQTQTSLYIKCEIIPTIFGDAVLFVTPYIIVLMKLISRLKIHELIDVVFDKICSNLLFPPEYASCTVQYKVH